MLSSSLVKVLRLSVTARFATSAVACGIEIASILLPCTLMSVIVNLQSVVTRLVSHLPL